MTDRNGNAPWELPKDGNQWGSPDSSGYGWRFPFRDDELDDNGPDDSETAEMPVPDATPAPAPSDTGAEPHPSSDADSAYATSPTADTRETASKPRGMGKGAVAALAIGVAIVAAAAGFGGGWFLQQPKIDEAEANYSAASFNATYLEMQLNEARQTHADAEGSLEENYTNALQISKGWPICNLEGYTNTGQHYWTVNYTKDTISPAGVGCLYKTASGSQTITVTAGFPNNHENADQEGSFPDGDRYKFVHYVDDGIWINVLGPDDDANKQTAEEVERELTTLKNQTPSS